MKHSVDQNDNSLKKAVFYRARYRGGKEADAILGGFAQDRTEFLNQTELTGLFHLLSYDDHVIFQMIEDEQGNDPTIPTSLLKKLKEYQKSLVKP